MKFSYKTALLAAVSALTMIVINKCATAKKITEPDMKTISRCDDLKNNESSGFAKIQGRLEQDYFTNKVGRKNYDIAEWYLFLEDGCRIYLKDYVSLRDQFEKAKDQNVILTGMLRYGQVDSDDRNVQSRVGHMLHVKSIQAQ